MQVIKQHITVPPSREINIKLPIEAATNEEAEVIVLFKSSAQSNDEKLAMMKEAMNDELFVADLNETMSDFAFADGEVKPS